MVDVWRPELPRLGVGLGYRDVWRAELFMRRADVDFLEITADHFLNAPPERLHELELLARHFRIVPHALNLSLGSAAGVDMRYVEQLADLIARVKAPWWSEHIAFTVGGDRDIGHLSPVPRVEAMIDVFCRNIERVRAVIDTPLILENITYTVRIPGATMSEAAFISQLLDAADCGLLLDVTNLHVNSHNHDEDPLATLDALPLHRVVQLHFVGARERHGALIDDHAMPTSPAIFALMEEVFCRAPVRGAILERDAEIPAFGALIEELEQAREAASRGQRRGAP